MAATYLRPISKLPCHLLDNGLRHRSARFVKHYEMAAAICGLPSCICRPVVHSQASLPRVRVWLQVHAMTISPIGRLTKLAMCICGIRSAVLSPSKPVRALQVPKDIMRNVRYTFSSAYLAPKSDMLLRM